MLQKKLLLKNIIILTVTSLILRTIGIAYKVFVSNRIGTEGMGLYQLTLSAFMFAVTFATSGISISVMRLVSEEIGRGRHEIIPHIIKRAFAYALNVSLTAAAVMFIFSDFIANDILNDHRATLSIKLLAPSLPFMAVASCIKGYFYAIRSTAKPAAGEIIEQFTEMTVFAVLVGILAPKGVEYGCAAIVIGTTISEFASCVYLYILYNTEIGKMIKKDTKGITKRILSIALPVASSSCLGAGLRTLENIMIPEGLKKYGDSTSKALSQYGMVRGMAIPVMFFPSAFLSAFSSLMIPEISEASVHNVKRINFAISRVLWMSFLLSIAVTGVFIIFAEKLGQIIYDSREIGHIMMILAPLIPLMYLDTIVDGMLKGLNQQMHVLWYNIFDSLIRILLIAFIVPTKGFYGFIAVMYVSNILNPVLSLKRLFKVTGIKMNWLGWIVKPILAAALSGSILSLIVKLNHLLFYGVFGVILGCITFVAMYMLLIMVMGCISRDDIEWVYNSITS